MVRSLISMVPLRRGKGLGEGEMEGVGTMSGEIDLGMSTSKWPGVGGTLDRVAMAADREENDNLRLAFLESAMKPGSI